MFHFVLFSSTALLASAIESGPQSDDEKSEAETLPSEENSSDVSMEINRSGCLFFRYFNIFKSVKCDT